ncbi:hypothetical protein PVL29_022567 [Vitis rotundifolia]|uniref:Uncharacterized protein n=1 Tax=Vitis rotundifolia TaxID=103349 RepID=A0AA39DBF9_VITRO|nr:hypothetical protein PVL29_022567 [Vitis rotundifolia]
MQRKRWRERSTCQNISAVYGWGVSRKWGPVGGGKIISDGDHRSVIKARGQWDKREEGDDGDFGQSSSWALPFPHHPPSNLHRPSLTHKERANGWLWWVQEMKALTSVLLFNDISKKRNVLKWQGKQRNGGEPNTLFLRWGID